MKSPGAYYFLLLLALFAVVGAVELFLILPKYALANITVQQILLGSAILLVGIPVLWHFRKTIFPKEKIADYLLLGGVVIQFLTLFAPLQYGILGLGILTICVFLYFLLNKNRRLKIYYLPLTLFFLLFLIMRVVGVSWAEDKANAWHTVESALAFLLYPLLFSMIAFNEKTIRRLSLLLVRCTLLYCLLSLLKAFYQIELLQLSLSDSVSTSMRLWVGLVRH